MASQPKIHQSIKVMIHNPNYRPIDPAIWSGRKTAVEHGPQYWYQFIDCIDIHSLNQIDADVALLGYATDVGVKRNQGRPGAQLGPEACRQKLAKLAYHHESLKAVDVGDIICIDDNLEECQAALGQVVDQLISASVFPIVIGGGHDIALGHFLGIYKALDNQPQAKIGIINFDAHFDLRSAVDGANSGTPFNQIMSAYGSQVDYLAVGIQQAANTSQLFKRASDMGARYVSSDRCTEHEIQSVLNQLSHFVEDMDHIFISIDMDGLSSAFAPGVSAPSPIGFTPRFLFHCLSHLFSTQKVISCDIAELNPVYDMDGMTAKLTAQIVDYIVRLLNLNNS